MSNDDHKGDASMLLDMTVEQLVLMMKEEGAFDRQEGRGHLFVVEDEFGGPALAIIVGAGKYAQSLIEHHELCAPGVKFRPASPEESAKGDS